MSIPNYSPGPTTTGYFQGDLFKNVNGTKKNITLTTSTDYITDSVLEIGSAVILEIPATSSLEIESWVDQPYLNNTFASETLTLTNKTLQTNLATVQTLNGNPVWQYLGYAQITSNSTTTSTTAATPSVPIGVTVTVPTGYTKVKITVYTVLLQNSATTNSVITLWRGTVGSGTQVQQWDGNQATFQEGANLISIDTPTAGSVTYNVGLNTVSTGTATITAASNYPAFILMECC